MWKGTWINSLLALCLPDQPGRRPLRGPSSPFTPPWVTSAAQSSRLQDADALGTWLGVPSGHSASPATF